MDTLKPQAKGGYARGILARKEALERYYANPNYCENCGKIIHPEEGKKIQEARRKRFCDHSCAAIYSNIKRGRVDRSGPCLRCGDITQYNKRHSRRERLKRHYCDSCKEIRRKERSHQMLGVTKGHLFSEYKNWQSARSTIQRLARMIYINSGSPMVCSICGYCVHVEIGHIRAVSTFPDEATLEEINLIGNLIPLCPNHHWEYDHDQLSLEDHQNK